MVITWNYVPRVATSISILLFLRASKLFLSQHFHAGTHVIHLGREGQMWEYTISNSVITEQMFSYCKPLKNIYMMLITWNYVTGVAIK